MRTLFAVAVLACVGCGKGGKSGDPGEFELLLGDWIITGTANSNAVKNAHEPFSDYWITALLEQRPGTRLDRVLPGTRVTVNVRPGGPVPPGAELMYGTIVSIDVFDKRLKLRDCVFGKMPAVPADAHSLDRKPARPPVDIHKPPQFYTKERSRD